MVIFHSYVSLPEGNRTLQKSMQLSKKRIDEDYPTGLSVLLKGISHDLLDVANALSQSGMIRLWPVSSSVQCSEPFAKFIELDDGKNYRKPLYLMVKTHGFPVNCPLNQSNEKYADLARPFPDGQAVPAEVHESLEQQIRQAQNGRFETILRSIGGSLLKRLYTIYY